MSKTKFLPIYMDMYQDIKKKIADEFYPVGSFLPTEAELQKAYNVSRTTVRRAVAKLQEDGLILVKQGFGTQILKRKISQSLNSITSVSESLRKMGKAVDVCNMHIERVRASYELAEELHLEIGEPVILISRIQSADGAPITIAKNYIPEKLVPDMINRQENIVSLYKYIKEKYNIDITKVEDRISAASATFDDAVALDIAPKTALIVVRRICYAGQQPVEVDYVKIIASEYEYRNDFEVEKQ